ncbi:MAG: hypothetical protein ACRD52_03320 [Candidatus Acidiferrales bacterium]
MMHRISQVLMLVCAAALVSLGAMPSQAQDKMQEKPPLYTYVAQWATPRAQWPDMVKGEASEKGLMDKLMADGTIVSYGAFRTVVHTVDGPTHGSWFSAMSMANLMKALSELMASGASTGPALEGSKHWDMIMSSTQYNGQSGTFENSYLRVGNWTVKAGGGEAVEKFDKEIMVPTLEKLLADGSIHAYQIDEETIHTGNPGSIDVVVLTNGAEGLDKFYAALDAMGKTNGLADMAFGQAVDEASHRDSLSLVPSYTHK